MHAFSVSSTEHSKRPYKKTRFLFELFWKPPRWQVHLKNVCRNNKCGKKNHILLHGSFDIKLGSKKSIVKAFHSQGTGQVAVVPVQLEIGEKTLNTYTYLDNDSCQSLCLGQQPQS